ncbi:hypothetical protein [uncultured Polaribacter sp.]|uniref:hypothetical protein n=1 Tax=uncultured Polaribacter sp. TaxID=174711 RepID=UPI00259BB787|nr:hypothetical protein [uncultured Polaribacter sp.]
MKKPEEENKITFSEKNVVKEIYNAKKSMLLVLNYKSGMNQPITFNYKVLDLPSKEIIKTGVFIGNKIEWLDNTSLKCYEHTGMIQKEDKSLDNYKIIKITNPK